MFLGIACAVKQKDKSYAIYLTGLGISTLILLIVVARNIVVLGAPCPKHYFPSYIAARVLSLGNIFSRIEGTISINFILAGIVKISVCLMAARKEASRLFGIQDHRKLVMPVGLLALALCAIVYDSTMEMFSFVEIYQYYALPFQVAIPAAV